MRGRPSTEVRRRAILDAAVELFAERGVAATSVEDIRARSGASIGSIYHHFGSKDSIAAAIHVEAIADYQREAAGVLESARSAADGIRGVVVHFLSWVERRPALAHLMLAVEHDEVRRLAGPQVAELNEAFFRIVGRWITGQQRKGALPAVPMDLLMPAVLGPARRFAELWLEGRTTTPIDEAASVLADVAWSGLRRKRNR